MKAVTDGIWAAWNASAPLKAALPRFYFQQAPPSHHSDFPYGVFRIVAGSQDDTFGAAQEVEEMTIQFNLYSNSWNTTEIFSIFDAFVAVFDWAALVIPAWNTTWCRREVSELGFEDGVYDYMLQYSVRCSQ